LAFVRYQPHSGVSDPDLIGGPRIFDNDWNTTASRTIQGVSVLAQGAQPTNLRTSGASGIAGNRTYGGEISPDWISITNYTVSYPSAAYKGLTVAEDAVECVSGGDSGGAIYLDQGAEAQAVGISGTNNSGGGPMNCRSYYSPLNGLWFNARQIDLY
jgi:hypothetical protein